jgi:hypothetical protein
MTIYILDSNGDFLLDDNGDYIIQYEAIIPLSATISGGGSSITVLDQYTPYAVASGSGSLSCILSSEISLSANLEGTSGLYTTISDLPSEFSATASGSGSMLTLLDRFYNNALDHITIELNGEDVTKYLLEYSREHQVCTGIHLATMKFGYRDLDVNLWDEIILYEYDTKIAKFYVAKIDKPANENLVSLELQDMSKKMSDYLIDEVIDLSKPKWQAIPEALKVKYWIQYFLDLAGIDVRFEVSDDGGTMGINSTLGMQMLYDQILTLLQMAGWYYYFDPDGTCVIDTLSIKKSYGNNYDYKLLNSQILNIEQNLDDSQLRNLAVVWGNSNPQYPLVYVYKKRGTSWQIDNDDWRAVVLSNHSIYSLADANKLAKQILDTFSPMVKEKTVTFINDPGISIGELVYIDSDVYNGVGRATTVSVECSAKGMVHKAILDQRCPRLFAYLGTPPLPPDYLPVRWAESNSQGYYNTIASPNVRIDDEYNIRSSNITGTITNIFLL